MHTTSRRKNKQSTTARQHHARKSSSKSKRTLRAWHGTTRTIRKQCLSERRTKEVVLEYNGKSKKLLDNEFVNDVMRDGNNNVVGPFKCAQKRFHWRQIIPICPGWFCEVGKDFRKIIRQLAREAASSDEWLKISPLTINNDRKGGAFSIMLQQFTRAIGIAIVLRIVKHKVGWLHYVRVTAKEAAA